MKRMIPGLITTIAGLVFAISYFVPVLGGIEGKFGDWVTIVQAFAIWLGVINLSMVTLDRVIRRRHDWQYGIVILASLIATLVVGFWVGFSGINAAQPYSYNETGYAFNWLYVYIFTPLGSMMFAILAFYVASASYRAFRARNLEATILLVAAFFVMGGRVPLLDSVVSTITGDSVTFFSQFAQWIMSFPVTAGQRAIAIGIALGIMASSLRVILGIERSHVGS